jgi:hypothetical protein
VQTPSNVLPRLGSNAVRALERPLLTPLMYLTIALSPVVWAMNVLSYLNGSRSIGTALTGFTGAESRQQLDFATLFSRRRHPGSWRAKCWPCSNSSTWGSWSGTSSSIRCFARADAVVTFETSETAARASGRSPRPCRQPRLERELRPTTASKRKTSAQFVADPLRRAGEVRVRRDRGREVRRAHPRRRRLLIRNRPRTRVAGAP